MPNISLIIYAQLLLFLQKHIYPLSFHTFFSSVITYSRTSSCRHPHASPEGCDERASEANIDAHFIDDIRTIITKARSKAYQSINEALIRSNWEIGKRIVEEEQLGKQRADYGIQLIKSISQQLTTEFGSGYGVRNLAYFKQLYQYFPDWEILHTRVQNLSWSHLRCILRVDDAQARLWYIQEAAEQMWSVRTLDRNVASQYYYRLLQTRNEHKDEVENEMKTLTKGYADSPAMFIKSPMVTEFLGLSRDMSFSESELESAIITHLQKFLMEMGKGYAFVERQQHIKTERAIQTTTYQIRQRNVITNKTYY